MKFAPRYKRRNAMKWVIEGSLAIVLGWAAIPATVQPAAAQPLPQPGEETHGGAEDELPLLIPQASAPGSSLENARAYLGVTFDPQVRLAAVVQAVASASPAEQAGVRAGDVIEALNGQRVSSYDDVLAAIRWMKPGDAIDLDVSRRVSVRTRVVLDRSTAAAQHVAGYAPDSAGPNALAGRIELPEEALPAPTNYRQRARQPYSQYNGVQSATRGYNDSANRRITGDSDRRRTDRSYRGGRALFPRRRN
jgi:membrane-associated protease RseP (regulator of RpoE activity)